MVDKDDHETLENALKIEEGKDQVTLFTCTPYGVNSHRLLVRGTRVAYNGEEDKEATISESMVESIKNYYMIYNSWSGRYLTGDPAFEIFIKKEEK